MTLHELAGKPAPRSLLINVPRVVSAYYTHKPDVSDSNHRVVFGTSGHRGSSLRNSFNEDHILSVSQAICEYRKSKDITGPLFMGMDTHALSEAALATAHQILTTGYHLLVKGDMCMMTRSAVVPNLDRRCVGATTPSNCSPGSATT